MNLIKILGTGTFMILLLVLLSTPVLAVTTEDLVITVGIIDINNPTIVLITPPDNAVDVDTNISFQCSATDDIELDKIEFYIDGNLNITTVIIGTSYQATYMRTLLNGNYNWSCKSFDKFGNSNQSSTYDLVVNTNEAPIYTFPYFSGTTTDWNSTPDITNVCDGEAILDNPLTDMIQWHNCVNASGENFDLNVLLEHNNVTVIFGLDNSFNSSATVTIRNLSWDSTPVVFRDGALCGGYCSAVTYNVSIGTAIFNVTGFSSYTTQGNAQLEIWDQTDAGMLYGGMTRRIGESIKFYSNYSKVIDGTPITGGNCSIQFDDLNATMAYNPITLLYEYTRSFAVTGTYDWNVSCNNTSYQYLETNDTVFVEVGLSPGSGVVPVEPEEELIDGVWDFLVGDGVCQYSLGENREISPSDCRPTYTEYASCLFDRGNCYGDRMWTEVSLIVSLLILITFMVLYSHGRLYAKKGKRRETLYSNGLGVSK